MPTINITVPEEIGDVDECVIVTWLKQEGDTVEKDDVLFIVQAEKVAFDVPAPASGTLTKIIAPQGEVVNIGQVVAQMEVATDMAPTTHPETQEEKPAVLPSSPQIPVRASPIAKRLAREHNIDLSQVVGTGKDGRITEKDIQRVIKKPALASSTPKQKPRHINVSPLAKRIAKAHGINLAQVTGTGNGGRITQKDVEAFIEASSPAQPPTSTDNESVAATEKTIPMTGIRAAVARNMYHSLQSMAQLTLHTEADVTELVVFYQSTKQQLPALSYTDLIVRACALALQQHPTINATLDNDVIRVLPHINIGIAVALEEGLIVPVITDAVHQSLANLVRIRQELVTRARNGRLTSDQIHGSTFTVTNLGGFGIDGFTPIINPPEAAILGVGRIVEKVVVYQGKIAQRHMMVLSLTIDHRVVDGAPGAVFLQTVGNLLQSPATL